MELQARQRLLLAAYFVSLGNDGEAYAALLNDAGVFIELIHYPAAMIYGFLKMDRFLPAAN